MPLICASTALSVMLAACFVSGASLARDERRAEQVLGDDDPITLAASVVPELSSPTWRLRRDLDPETTGSVSVPKIKCRQIAWFPERAPADQFRLNC